MPRVIGPWLCGLYDGDRMVTVATEEALHKVFPPPKLHDVRKAYQKHLLQYCRNTIDNEFASTLSDQRIVSKEDAAAKYNRVLSACIAMATSQVRELSPAEKAKHRTEYEELASDSRMWAHATDGEATVRRSLHRLLRVLLTEEKGKLWQPATSNDRNC